VEFRPKLLLIVFEQYGFIKRQSESHLPQGIWACPQNLKFSQVFEQADSDPGL